MPSVSSAQQAIMGQAWAVRTGEMKISEVAPKYRKEVDRKSTRLNSSHIPLSRMPSSA